MLRILTYWECRHSYNVNSSATIALTSSVSDKGFQEKLTLNKMN